MSSTNSLRNAGRTLGYALRPSPVAGPSRIPLHTPRLRSLTTTHVPRKAVTDVCARTARPMTSILDGLAVMRAVESKYGKVIDFQIPRDPDSLQPTNLVFISFLDPVELGSTRQIHEIPAPVSELGDKQIYGGPSLADVRAALSSETGVDRRNSSSTTGKMITFELEVRRQPMSRRRSPSMKKVTPEMIVEDEKILDALERFGDGFYGGFEGVAASQRKVLEEQKAQLGKEASTAVGANATTTS